MLNLSISEPEDFEFDHYPTCPAALNALEECDCVEETRKIHEDFKAARYELERGN